MTEIQPMHPTFIIIWLLIVIFLILGLWLMIKKLEFRSLLKRKEWEKKIE